MGGSLLTIIFDDEDKLNVFDTLLEYVSQAMHDGDGKDSVDLKEAIQRVQPIEASKISNEIIEHDWFWNFDPEYGQFEDESSGKPAIELLFGIGDKSEELNLLKKWLTSFGAVKVRAEESEFWGELEE
jgi:hypothetical protein